MDRPNVNTTDLLSKLLSKIGNIGISQGLGEIGQFFGTNLLGKGFDLGGGIAGLLPAIFSTLGGAMGDNPVLPQIGSTIGGLGLDVASTLATGVPKGLGAALGLGTEAGAAAAPAGGLLSSVASPLAVAGLINAATAPAMTDNFTNPYASLASTVIPIPLIGPLVGAAIEAIHPKDPHSDPQVDANNISSAQRLQSLYSQGMTTYEMAEYAKQNGLVPILDPNNPTQISGLYTPEELMYNSRSTGGRTGTSSPFSPMYVPGKGFTYEDYMPAEGLQSTRLSNGQITTTNVFPEDAPFAATPEELLLNYPRDLQSGAYTHTEFLQGNPNQWFYNSLERQGYGQDVGDAAISMPNLNQQYESTKAIQDAYTWLQDPNNARALATGQYESIMQGYETADPKQMELLKNAQYLLNTDQGRDYMSQQDLLQSIHGGTQSSVAMPKFSPALLEAIKAATAKLPGLNTAASQREQEVQGVSLADQRKSGAYGDQFYSGIGYEFYPFLKGVVEQGAAPQAGTQAAQEILDQMVASTEQAQPSQPATYEQTLYSLLGNNVYDPTQGFRYGEWWKEQPKAKGGYAL